MRKLIYASLILFAILRLLHFVLKHFYEFSRESLFGLNIAGVIVGFLVLVLLGIGLYSGRIKPPAK